MFEVTRVDRLYESVSFMEEKEMLTPEHYFCIVLRITTHSVSQNLSLQTL